MKGADDDEASTAGQPDLAELKAVYEAANTAIKKASAEYERLRPIYWAARAAYRDALADVAGESTEEQKQAERAHLAAVFGPLEPITERQNGEEANPNSFENGPAEG